MKNIHDELPNMDKDVLKKMWDDAWPTLEPKDRQLGAAGWVAEKIMENELKQIDQTNPVTKGSTALVYKEETLEDAAQSYAVNQRNRTSHYMGFIEGAKWQSERMYSEEDIKLAFEAGHKKGFSGYPNTENWKELPFKEWFEQFKKEK